MFWWSIAILTVVTTHSGLCLPGLPNARMHDAHHELSGECFGSLGLLDALHGTNRRFMARQAKSRSMHGWLGVDPIAVAASMAMEWTGLGGTETGSETGSGSVGSRIVLTVRGRVPL